MTQFREYDVVRIARLEKSHRPIDGTSTVMRQPQIGDTGTIVHISVTATGKVIHFVESADSEGNTIWLADFTAEELVLVLSGSGAGRSTIQ